MPDLRLGVIGAGRLSSSRIYPCLHTLPVELAAVCDMDRDKAAHNARRFGGQAVYTDHRRMLAEAALDAVIVCTGPEGHARLAIEVMEAGLPVYTEKPPAINAADARAMLQTSRTLNQICMTGFKKRFAPAYRKARAAIQDEAFGAPSLLSIDYACGPTYPNDPADPRGQFLLDFCIHILDLSRFLFGEVAEVYARTRGQTSYAVNLLFENGALGVIALSSNRDWEVSTEKVELTGGPGQFMTLANSVGLVRYAGNAVVDWHSPTFSTARGDSLVETGFQPELAEFVAAVRERREPESSIASSFCTMCLYEAIVRSVAAGRPVAVEMAEVPAG
ncbi:MAG: Gfo/Idh/MocA family protein [Thermomicrobiales bacterium]